MEEMTQLDDIPKMTIVIAVMGAVLFFILSPTLFFTFHLKKWTSKYFVVGFHSAIFGCLFGLFIASVERFFQYKELLTIDVNMSNGSVNKQTVTKNSARGGESTQLKYTPPKLLGISINGTPIEFSENRNITHLDIPDSLVDSLINTSMEKTVE